jgi:hypothetical protein
VRCDKCGRQEAALKTVRLRADAGRRGTLCDGCWEPVRHLVWIVPGPVCVTSKCARCHRFCHPRELDPATARPGGHGKRDLVSTGLCFSCSGGQTCDNGERGR